jgi:hypothetical protein
MFRAALCRPGRSAYLLVHALGNRKSPRKALPAWAGVMKRCGLCR